MQASPRHCTTGWISQGGDGAVAGANGVWKECFTQSSDFRWTNWSEFLGLRIEVLNSCVAYHCAVFCIHVYILESVSPSFLWRGEIPLRVSAAEQSDLYWGVLKLTCHAYYKVRNPERNDSDLLHFLLIVVSLLLMMILRKKGTSQANERLPRVGQNNHLQQVHSAHLTSSWSSEPVRFTSCWVLNNKGHVLLILYMLHFVLGSTK